MKTLPAEITIARPSYSDWRKLITIKIIDKKSHCLAIEVEIGYAEFAQTLTGLGAVDCQMTLNDSDVIGKKSEYKEEIIKIPTILLSNSKSQKQKEALRAILECYEVDGWRANDNDAVNRYNLVENQGDTCRVQIRFTRSVEED